MVDVEPAQRVVQGPAQVGAGQAEVVGALPIGKRALVAMTSRSRAPCLRESQRPMIDSDVPALYTSAVSIRVPPAST